MNTELMFSSVETVWETPQWLFDLLDETFHFTLDPCALPQNAKCKEYFTPEDDGLSQAWAGTVFMNPPYGDAEQPCKPNCKKKKCAKRGWHTNFYIPGIADWLEKAYLESRKDNCRVVALIPARTDTKAWHNYVMKANQIIFIKGRLKFGTPNGETDPAPFPSVIAVFNNDTDPLIFSTMDNKGRDKDERS